MSTTTEYTLRAPAAVYAAALVAGLRHHLDEHMTADYRQIQWYSPAEADEDFREPVRTVTHWADRAQREGELPDAVYEDIRTIEREARRGPRPNDLMRDRPWHWRSDQAKKRIREWVRSTHPEILTEEG